MICSDLFCPVLARVTHRESGWPRTDLLEHGSLVQQKSLLECVVRFLCNNTIKYLIFMIMLQNTLATT